MRDHSSLRSSFWTGATGKKLRKHPDAQRLALYLMSSPHGNMAGIFVLPLMYAANEVGMSVEQVETAMAVLADLDFARYDIETETVWVVAGAAYQLDLLADGAVLTPADNRTKSVRRFIEAARKSSLYPDYVRHYAQKLSLGPNHEGASKPLRSPFEGASKGSAVQLEAPSKGPEPHGEDRIRTGSGEGGGSPFEGAPPAAPPHAPSPDPSARPAEQTAVVTPVAFERAPWTAERAQVVFRGLFTQRYQTEPSMGGKNLSGFSERVASTAKMQRRQPEELYREVLAIWLSKPRGDAEKRAPFACFVQAWGELTMPPEAVHEPSGVASARPRDAPPPEPKIKPVNW